MTTPKLVFIVPYRDREQQLHFFQKQMKEVMKNVLLEDYKILYIHQCDNRGFNRGAMKNIGFLFVKQHYPETYHNITLVFNDIDTMTYTADFLNYETVQGRVKHFYGYKHALGGIVSIVASDFEKVNGYPNFWSWGYEDNLLQFRVLKAKMVIDRNQFYPIMDKNIIHFGDGLEKEVNRSEFERYSKETLEGINSITNLEYQYDEYTGFVNVSSFQTGKEENVKTRSIHDIRAGSKPFGDVIVPRRSYMKLLFR